MSHSSNVNLRALIDASNPSATAKVLKLLAQPFSLLYSSVVRSRNFAYDHELIKSQYAPLPVVSVGNITMGGVGKTPFVAWLTKYISSSGKKVALVSRGYKAEAQKELLNSQRAFINTLPWLAKARALEPESSHFFHFNDEACELALRFPETPHFLNANRLEATYALSRLFPETDAFILDDAFQHRRIKRDFDVLLLDALTPFGGGYVAPAGYLREPISGIKRADVVILSRADLIPASQRENIRKRVSLIAPHAIWCEIAQRPSFIIQRFAKSDSVELQVENFSQWQKNLISPKRVVAFCGLGAPEGFKKTLIGSKFNLADFVSFPDHCVYTREDFLSINKIANKLNADVVMTTMKDFVKLSGREPIDKPVVALGIDVVFLAGELEFKQALMKALERQTPCSNHKNDERTVL